MEPQGNDDFLKKEPRFDSADLLTLPFAEDFSLSDGSGNDALTKKTNTYAGAISQNADFRAV